MPEDVQILGVRRAPQILSDGRVMEFVEIQYHALGLPIGRVTITADQDTPEGRAKAIREDLKIARVTEPTRLTIPDA